MTRQNHGTLTSGSNALGGMYPVFPAVPVMDGDVGGAEQVVDRVLDEDDVDVGLDMLL